MKNFFPIWITLQIIDGTRVVKEERKVFFFRLIFFIFAILNILVTVNLSFAQVEDEKKREEERIKEWEKALKLYPVAPKAIKLDYKFSFPGNDLERGGVYFVGADHLCFDNDGNIYISDSRENCIYKVDLQGRFLKKMGRRGQGPKEFNNVLFLDTDKENNLIVYDGGNRRIQILDSNGDYLRSFKIFNTGWAMVCNKRGYIYAGLRAFNLNDPLVGVFDYQGKMISSFGQRLKFPSRSFGSLPIHLSMNNKNEIFLTWWFFPIVRRYSERGELLSEYKIEHKIMQEDGKKNYEVLSKTSDSSPRLDIITTNIRAKDDGFYLLRYYPRIELLEVGLDGEIKNIYWADQTYDFIASDFLIKEDDKEKYFYILQRYPENKIIVYSAKK